MRFEEACNNLRKERLRKFTKEDTAILNAEILDNIVQYSAFCIANKNYIPNIDEIRKIIYKQINEAVKEQGIESNIKENEVKFIYKVVYPYVIENAETWVENEVENKKFNENLELWKEGIEFAKDRIENFYKKEAPDTKYMTLEELGIRYSTKLANIMFDFGYGEWVFKECKNLIELKKQLINILEEDEDLDEILQRKNLTKNEIFKRIKGGYELHSRSEEEELC